MNGYIRNTGLLIIGAICILVSCCGVNCKLKHKDTSAGVIIIDSAAIGEDTTALNIIRPYKDSLDIKMNEILAYSEAPMMKAQPEGELNNFLADLLLIMSNKQYEKLYKNRRIDLCLLNNGGIRSSLPKGEITLRNVYELMPFDNLTSVLTISGKQTKNLFDYVASEGGMPISGVKFGIQNNKAVNIYVNSVAFDTTRNYTVVTSDYLANGGDKMDFFRNPLKRVELDLKVRDAIVEYMQMLTAKGETINPKLDKRIYYEQ